MTAATKQTGPDVKMFMPFLGMDVDDGAMFDAIARAGRVYTQSYVELQEELTRFATARLAEDGKLTEALTSCRNLSDLTKVQQDWAMGMVESYLTEVRRLVDLASRVTRHGLKPSREPEAEAISSSNGEKKSGSRGHAAAA